MTIIKKFDISNAKKAGVETGGTLIGFLGAYQLAKLAKQNTLLINAGLAVTGVAVATMIGHPFVQAIGVGIAVYGGIKCVNNLVAPVADPAAEAVHGILPQAVKDHLSAMFPALGEVDDFGSANDNQFNEPAYEVRAINGFNFPINGADLEMSGSLMMS